MILYNLLPPYLIFSVLDLYDVYREETAGEIRCQESTADGSEQPLSPFSTDRLQLSVV